MSSEIAIRAEDLHKTYCLFDRPIDRLKQSLFRNRRLFYRPLEALKPISFTVQRGETLGIIGCNGSGKSTLLQIIAGTVAPTGGTLDVHGRISALLELGAGFNPEFSGAENIRLNAAILGLLPEEIDEKYAGIVAFSGIGDFLDRPVKTYSSGMYVRLAFAVAVASDPDILVVDEALAVGDEAFQRKCYARIREIQERGGTILFVSHSAGTVVEVCSRALLLDAGELLLSGSPKRVVSQYHKLIYAPEGRRTTLRDSLKDVSEHPSDDDTPSASFDPTLRPESTIIYESKGATISNVRITTLDDKSVNRLMRGNDYFYTYTVTYDRPCSGVRCGMNIKTKSGVELGGSGTYSEQEPMETVEAGTVFHVRFRFRCLLLPGTYFINAGTSGIVDGERTFLHRVIDACMFRVEPETGHRLAGFVDFMITSEITKTPAS